MILNKISMKTKKLFLTTAGYITGMISGVVIMALLSFSNTPATPVAAGGNTPVSADVARSFYTKYMTDAAPFNQVIKGFTIDKAQLEAMNAIAKENAELAGFRIYMGKDYAGRKVALVVGVDNTGKDAVKNTIFSSDAQQVSPCPPVCDATSPIILDK